MIGRRARHTIAAALSILTAPAVLAADGDGYALHLPVAAAGTGVQRITLPAQAIAALKRSDGADVRVIDAGGRAVPLARVPAVSADNGRSIALEPLPILGAVDGLRVTGVTLRLDDSGSAKVARVEGAPAASGAMLLGILLDTRQIEGAAAKLALDIDLPAGQPISFAVEASSDLDEWSPLARRTIYRATGAVGTEAIDLGGATLRGRWIRLRWTATTRLLSPITVRAARIETRLGDRGTGSVAIDAALPAHDDPRAVEFVYPFAVPALAMELRPGPGAALISYRVLGRSAPEQSWSLLGAGTASGTRSGQTAVDWPSISPMRTIRIEADPRGDPLVPGTQVRFALAPVDIAFLGSGRPPFTLAVGQADASDAFLPIATLLSGAGIAGPERLAAATIAAAPTPRLQLTPAGGGNNRAWLLWGMLLAGTLVLGLLVLKMARSRPRTLGDDQV